MESIDVEFQLHVDLQIYCCKFHNKEPKVKHTYFLTIPGKDDSAVFRINFDQTAEPNEETVTIWTNQYSSKYTQK